MSESRHRNQAQNIVEYAWRHRNHNDDIPRQYLTDILVGSIAEALRIAYTTSYAKEYEDEKARRVYYQDIVYDVCNSLDMAAGRSVTKGQGIVCGTKDEPHDSVQKEMKSVVAELTTLRAQVAGLEKDTIVLAHAVQAWTVSEGPHTKACQEGGDSRCSACIAFECRDAVTRDAKDAVQRAIDLEEAASAVKEPA